MADSQPTPPPATCSILGVEYTAETLPSSKGAAAVAALLTSDGDAVERFNGLLEDAKTDFDAACTQLTEFACAASCKDGAQAAGCPECPPARACPAYTDEANPSCEFALGPTPCCHTSTEAESKDCSSTGDFSEALPGCDGTWAESYENNHTRAEQWAVPLTIE